MRRLIFWLTGHLEVVKCRAFMNCRVPLDGFDFWGCSFTNVSFVWNGGPVKIGRGCSFTGRLTLETKNLAVRDAVDLLEALGLIREGVIPNPGTASHTVAMKIAG